MKADKSTDKPTKPFSPNVKSIVIVDDHPLFRKGLQELIQSDGTFAVSGEDADAVERLSDRELEILELIGKGNDVRQIAKLLHLSPKTVETHRSHIKDKLDLKNSREVARFALQWLSTRNA